MNVLCSHFRVINFGTIIVYSFPIVHFLKKDSQEAHRNLIPVGKVVYNTLRCLEKNFGRSLLQVLFSRVHLKEYPDLIHVHRIFKNGNQYPPLPFRSWSTSHLFIHSFAGLTSIHEMFTLSQDLCLSV